MTKLYDCNWCGGLHPESICPQSQEPVIDLPTEDLSQTEATPRRNNKPQSKSQQDKPTAIDKILIAHNQYIDSVWKGTWNDANAKAKAALARVFKGVSDA